MSDSSVFAYVWRGLGGSLASLLVVPVFMACVALSLRARACYLNRFGAKLAGADPETGGSRRPGVPVLALIAVLSGGLTLVVVLTLSLLIDASPSAGLWLWMILLWITPWTLVALARRAIRRLRRGANRQALEPATERFFPPHALGLGLLFATACGTTILLLLEYLTLARHFEIGVISGDRTDTFYWCVVVLPSAITGLFWRLGVRSPRWGLAGLMLLAPVFVYLAWDDAEVRQPMGYADLSPVQPGLAASNAVLLRWSSNTIRGMGIPLMPEGFRQASRPDSHGFWEWVRTHREAIERAGRANAKVRDWWAEWNAYPELGDFSNGSKSSAVNDQPISVHLRITAAEAAALAQDGRGDEAIERLLPLLIGGAKLQTHSRTLNRSMCVILLRKLAIDAANLIMKNAVMSPAMRARLADAVAAGQGGEVLARRLVAVNFADYCDHFADPRKRKEWTGGRVWSALIGPVLLNPNRTLNLLSDLSQELQELAARRDFDGMTGACERYHARVHARLSLKNVVGCVEIIGDSGRFIGVVKRYWEVEDKGAALIARLRAEPTAAVSAQSEAAK